MKRRDFLITATAGAAAVAGLPRSTRAQAMNAANRAKLDRVAIMSLNFDSMLLVPDRDPSPERTLELFDLPTMLADTYGVHGIEFQHYHLESTEPLYLRELRRRLEAAGSRMTQVNVEFGGEVNISVESARYRTMAVDLTKRWVDHVAMVGGKRVMINQGQLNAESQARATEALKRMADYGRSKGVIVSVETRGGGGGRGGTPPTETSRERWTRLAEVIEAAGAYSNVDVGGARAANQQDLHDCLKRMLPSTAGSMHTRLNDNWDLAAAMRYLENDLGWRGLYTIETGGGHEGTKAIYDVVMATL